jgi:hypothetical protein
MDERALRDELLSGLSRANPARLDTVRGAFDSVAVAAMLEEILRAPRLRRRAVAAGLRRARRLEGLDPFEMLGTANPVPVQRVAALATSDEVQRRALLLNSIIAAAAVPGAAWNKRRILVSVHEGLHHTVVALLRRRSVDDTCPRPTVRRSRRAIAVPLLGAAILVASAAGIVVARLHTTRLVTGCYAAAAIGHGSTSDALIVNGPDDVAGCQALWLKGAFGAPRKPHLVACILPSGNVGVFPGRNGQVCTTLNLSIALPPSQHVRTVAKLRNALDTGLRLSSCVDAGSARQIVRQDLGLLGLAGWHVILAVKPTAARRCTTAIIVQPDTVKLFPTYYIPTSERRVTTTT